MFFKVLLPVCLLGLAPHTLLAEPGLVISYDNVAQRVRAQNPDLTAARARIREAEGRLLGAGRMPNPEIEGGVEHNRRFSEWKAEVGFSQRFPVTDRLRLEKSVGRIEVEAARAEVRQVERDLIASARGAMVEALTLRQRRGLLEKQAGLANDLAAFLDGVAAKGEGSPLDAGQARIEAAGLDATRRSLDAQEAGAIGKLKSLLGIQAGTPLHVTGTLPAPSMAAPAADPARRADFQAKRLEAEAAAEGVALEEARRYEDIGAGVFVGGERTKDAPEGFEREAVVGLRLSIPLPLWNKNEGGIAEARARRERVELEAKALARNIRLEVEAARAEMERWAELVREIQDTLLPMADELSSAAEKAFREGQGELQAVFRSREKHLELANSRLDALKEFHLARIRHQAALGQP